MTITNLNNHIANPRPKSPPPNEIPPSDHVFSGSSCLLTLENEENLIVFLPLFFRLFVVVVADLDLLYSCSSKLKSKYSTIRQQYLAKIAQIIAEVLGGLDGEELISELESYLTSCKAYRHPPPDPLLIYSGISSSPFPTKQQEFQNQASMVVSPRYSIVWLQLLKHSFERQQVSLVWALFLSVCV
jgi:hypothetical protein